MQQLLLNTVFHPSDFSEGDELAFAHALKIAHAVSAELCLMHVREPMEKSYWADFPHVRDTLKQWGVVADETDKTKVKPKGLDNFKVEIVGADPVRTILHFIRQHCFDLIVLATHQRQGFDHWLHRNIAEKIARRSGEMTLFVPRHQRGFVSRESGGLSLRRILVPVGNQPHPQSAIDAAVGLAGRLGVESCELRTLHVRENDTDEPPRVALPDKAGWGCEHLVREGSAVETILETAREWEPDLIAMPTAGHQGFLDMIRGSQTERVLRESPCPLLAVQAFEPKVGVEFD